MGMTLDKYLKETNTVLITQDAFVEMKNTMRKYQQLQADYETRLKADMVAMLEELKEQLREMHEDFFETEHFDEAYGVSDSMDVIQQKISSLKEA